ncbi:nuclear pore complex subunit Nro1-domain-containing protein [Parasitella parasitica]|nr:nuclear pore complex subunit Nro1-domain-containing protein [Parasitella parasitica]
MPVEKKRPRGLKGSAAAKANKKTKTEEESGSNTELPENAQTIVIDKIVEEGDEVGEAAALFESAIEKLETDTAAALPLLRGTIHESDRILRNHKDKEPLPALFYYTYGSALYELGRLTEDEEFEPYLDAAEERLNESLERKDANLHSKIHIALGKIWLAKAASAVSEGDQNIPELSLKALATLDEALASSQVASKTIIELADIVQNHGDLYESLESRNKFISWAENALEKVLKDEPANAGALSGLGHCKLSFANFLLDNAEEIDENEEKTKLSEDEEKAYNAILEDLAETYLNEANLVLNEEEQSAIYQKAVDSINEANALIQDKKLEFILPDALTSFLEDFEAEK